MLKSELNDTVKLILKNNYQSEEPAKTLAPLRGGEWSAAYRFNADGRDLVIRLSHTPENFHRDRIAARWSSPDLPIPQIIRIDRYLDQYYAISPFFHGEPFENMPAAELEQTIPDFLSMMTALQSVSLDATKGYGTITPEGHGAFHSWSEALTDVINDRPDSLTHGWKKALVKIPTAQCKVDRFYKQLTELVRFCPDQKRPIHSDLLYQNLLVHNRKVSALLDWGCAMIGDPAYDIAIFEFFEPWYPAFTEVNLIQRMRQSYLTKSPDNSRYFEQRMAAYQIHLTLGNIAYCIYSDGKHDYTEHIDRLEEVLAKSDLLPTVP